MIGPADWIRALRVDRDKRWAKWKKDGSWSHLSPPGDVMLYLAFADWLEEQGSAWANHIREYVANGDHEYPMAAGVVAIRGNEPSPHEKRQVRIGRLEAEAIIEAVKGTGYEYIEDGLMDCVEAP